MRWFTLVAANPDAVQLTLGQARLLQALPGKQKPALVLRSDIANVYGSPLDEHLFGPHPECDRGRLVWTRWHLCQPHAVAGAAGDPGANIRSIMALRAEATRYAMPLMIAGDAGQCRRGRRLHGRRGHRQDHDAGPPGQELGADLIKADPTDTIDDYHKVIEVAGDVPVLVRGGGRVVDRTVERTAAVLAQGARGIVYGRNVVQHETRPESPGR